MSALPLPSNFDELKQLYFDLRRKLLQSVVPDEFYAELKAVRAKLRAASSEAEAAKKEWMRSWRCSVCGGSITRAAEFGVSAVAPDGPRGLYISRGDEVPEEHYSCARLEEAKRKKMTTYLFNKMTKADWDEIHRTIEAHKDFKIVEDTDARRRYEQLRKRVEELAHKVEELERKIENHHEFYGFLMKELKKDIQQVAKAIVEHAEKHDINLFEHFRENMNMVLCDADGFVV
jgi:hypothetical protein